MYYFVFQKYVFEVSIIFVLSFIVTLYLINFISNGNETLMV